MDTTESPARTSPVGAFHRIAWAFLFIGVTVGPSIRIGQEVFNVDLLPDFVGYLMIATAADRLVAVHRRARTVRNLALVLTYLSIPTVVQYAVVTSQSATLSTSRAPLWPLTVAISLLNLVLVWVLCGLVADLARRAGDYRTRDWAQVCRIVSVVLQVGVTVGIGLVLLAPARELVLVGAAGGIGIGLVLLIMMVSLMRRAERLVWEHPEAADEEGARRGGWGVRLLTAGGIILPVVLAIGTGYYYLNWQEERNDDARRASGSSYFARAKDDFYGPLRAGRVDDAYAATTEGFRQRVSREQFGELARRYADYLKAREKQHGASGASSSMGGHTATESEYSEVEPGRFVQVTVTIRRDHDSIFLRQPPPVKVDEFTVEEHAGPPKGGLLGPGR